MEKRGFELKALFDNFFEESPEGVITISYPNPLWEHNKDGISFTKGTYDNSHKFKFKEYGILIKQTLGFSLITGKHLYIPYSQIQAILFEDTIT